MQEKSFLFNRTLFHILDITGQLSWILGAPAIGSAGGLFTSAAPSTHAPLGMGLVAVGLFRLKRKHGATGLDLMRPGFLLHRKKTQ